MTQTYQHTELNERGDYGQCYASVEKLPYNGREILIRHYFGDKKTGASAIVLGFIQGEYMKPREETLVPTTDVEPVTDEAQRKELSDLLIKKGEQKPITFW
jgi:hypothetical protein